MTQLTNAEFEALLNYIKRNRGFDLSGYKRSTLMRRVRKRMQEVEIESYSDYIDFLEVHPQEFAQLFNTILINVTSFFRDLPAWDYIANEIVPQLIANNKPNSPIRIWSAACASGQEAYTLAIVLAEALGVEQFRSLVKIYATELDDEALMQARYAIYDEKQLTDVPANLRSKYFERSNSHYAFRKDLRRSVIFGRHNLVTDAPISRINLLVCRNTLMYFNAEVQAKIISRFHFALCDGGFLFLGKAEMLLSHSNSFTPVNLKQRIFIKVPYVNRGERLLLMGNDSNNNQLAYLSNHMRIRDAAFETCGVAQVVLNLNGSIELANEKARSLFNLDSSDLGRPLQDLQLSYQPVELRSRIEQVYSDLVAVNLKDIQWTTTSGDTYYLNVQISPLFDSSTLLGINITFADQTRFKQLEQEIQQANQELEMAYEELQSTNEELETTNEELQSSNEELETTNEELQSTNEELETMNEELQSSNDELQTINDELRQRSEDLNQVNAFLESIFTSMRGGVVVINPEMHILIWNENATDLWGLRATEVQGQHFLNLDIGLPVEQLIQPLRKCLAEDPNYIQLTLAATNRRGRAIQCKVTLSTLIGTAKEIKGVIMVMEEQPGADS